MDETGPARQLAELTELTELHASGLLDDAEFGAAMARVLGTDPEGVARRRRSGRRRRAVLAVAVLLVVGVAVAIGVVALLARVGGPTAAPGERPNAPAAVRTPPPPAVGFPAAYGGTWTGGVDQSGGTIARFTAQIVITPGTNSATVRYLELNCSGRMQFDATLPDGSIRVRELIDSGGCSSDVEVTLQVLAGGEAIAYEFVDSRSRGSATLFRE